MQTVFRSADNYQSYMSRNPGIFMHYHTDTRANSVRDYIVCQGHSQYAVTVGHFGTRSLFIIKWYPLAAYYSHFLQQDFSVQFCFLCSKTLGTPLRSVDSKSSESLTISFHYVNRKRLKSKLKASDKSPNESPRL